MKKLIHNLRQKPAHVRRTIAFVTSITVTFLVGLILVSNIKSLSTKVPVENTENKTPSPLALMYGGMKDFFKSTGNELAEVSTIFKSLQTTTTDDAFSHRDTIATSSDGAIGVSTTNYDTDNSNIDTLTEQQ